MLQFNSIGMIGSIQRGAAHGGSIVPAQYIDDMRFPMIGRNIDTASGRIEYNYFNGALQFNNNARYPNEPVYMCDQLSHKWVYQSTIYPHIHWLQQSSNIPNFILGWKAKSNGSTDVVETDYSNYTFSKLQTHFFTYTSGKIRQMSFFDPIALSSITTPSAQLHFVIFRDTANTKGLYSGVDPSALNELVYEFDVHIYLKDNI